MDCGFSEAARIQAEPVLLVQEELPVADDPMPHEDKRDGRSERPEVGVVDRRTLMTLVKRPEHDPVLLVRWNGDLLQDPVEQTSGAAGGEVCEHDDDRRAAGLLAVGSLSVQEQSPVARHELDDVRHVAVADLLRSEPELPAFYGPRYVRTDGPGAADVLVRLDDVTLDPVGDGAKRGQLAFRERARPSNVVELVDEEEIGGPGGHGFPPGESHTGQDVALAVCTGVELRRAMT